MLLFKIHKNIQNIMYMLDKVTKIPKKIFFLKKCLTFLAVYSIIDELA